MTKTSAITNQLTITMAGLIIDYLFSQPYYISLYLFIFLTKKLDMGWSGGAKVTGASNRYWLTVGQGLLSS